MSKVKSIVKKPTEETITGPLFEPFKYHREELENHNVNLPAHPMIRFLGRIQDVASGVAKIIEINNRDDTENDASENPQVLLSPNDHWQLSRLSIAALEMLGDKADELTDWSYRYYVPEGRAEHGVPDLGL
jgi:hypothetical protein